MSEACIFSCSQYFLKTCLEFMIFLLKTVFSLFEKLKLFIEAFYFIMPLANHGWCQRLCGVCVVFCFCFIGSFSFFSSSLGGKGGGVIQIRVRVCQGWIEDESGRSSEHLQQCWLTSLSMYWSVHPCGRPGLKFVEASKGICTLSERIFCTLSSFNMRWCILWLIQCENFIVSGKGIWGEACVFEHWDPFPFRSWAVCVNKTEHAGDVCQETWAQEPRLSRVKSRSSKLKPQMYHKKLKRKRFCHKNKPLSRKRENQHLSWKLPKNRLN